MTRASALALALAALLLASIPYFLVLLLGAFVYLLGRYFRSWVAAN